MLHKTTADLTASTNNLGAGDRLRAIVAQQAAILGEQANQPKPTPAQPEPGACVFCGANPAVIGRDDQSRLQFLCCDPRPAA